MADTVEPVYYGEPFNTNAKYEDWAGVVFQMYEIEPNFTWNNFFDNFIEIEKWESVDKWPEAVKITELSGVFPDEPHYFIRKGDKIMEVYGLNVYYEKYQEKQIILEQIINSLKIN